DRRAPRNCLNFRSHPLMLSGLKLPKWITLGILFPIIFVNGWLIFLLCQYLNPIPSIVISASLIAFLLEFPIDFVESRGMRRGWAIALVLSLAITLFSLIALILGPLVFEQLLEFANRLPVWLDQGSKQLQDLEAQGFFQNLPFDVSNLTDQLINQLSTTLKLLTSQLIGLTFETISSTVDLLLTVVLSVLLVINGPTLWRGLISWLPTQWRDRIETSLQPSFQSYFTGQTIIASILAIALSVAFTVLQIPFGLLFGLGIGVTSIIPFGGSLSIALVSLLLAFQNVWLGLKVLAVALILGQLNENIIAPRLIGGITGLNPAIVIVSLLVGAKVGGFLGLIVAVPTASFVKRIADTLQKNSDLQQPGSGQGKERTENVENEFLLTE
ncbi:MAG: AI-2E family transporter, partial [Cyanobacteria bacterium P01_A01_bin.114]